MENTHDPVIIQRPDGRWEVNCPDCLRLRDSGVDVPIGIGLSVRSWESAIRLWANHVRPGAESEGSQALVTSSRPPLPR
jgi:hypothetical protein